MGNISPAQSIAAIGGNTAESQSAAFIQVTACPTWPLMCTIVCDAARASRNKELCESWHYGVQDRHQPEELHRTGEKCVLQNKKRDGCANGPTSVVDTLCVHQQAVIIMRCFKKTPLCSYIYAFAIYPRKFNPTTETLEMW